jgi:hypothetical protein
MLHDEPLLKSTCRMFIMSVAHGLRVHVTSAITRPGVYISRWHHGSPAHRYGLYALHWIQQVCMCAVWHDTARQAAGRPQSGAAVALASCSLQPDGGSAAP